MYAFQVFSSVLFAFIAGERTMIDLMGALTKLCEAISGMNDDNDKMYRELCDARDGRDQAEARSKDASDKLMMMMNERDMLKEQIKVCAYLKLTHEELADLIACKYGPDQLINAIKEYRNITGLGLKDSKDLVEAAMGRAKAARE